MAGLIVTHPVRELTRRQGRSVSATHPTFAVLSDSRMTACCDGPLGAVKPLERPSWFTAVPSSIARGATVSMSPASLRTKRRGQLRTDTSRSQGQLITAVFEQIVDLVGRNWQMSLVAHESAMHPLSSRTHADAASLSCL